LEKEQNIIEMQGHAHDYANDIGSLTQTLEKEQYLSLTLE
jgi:hypothetical protein